MRGMSSQHAIADSVSFSPDAFGDPFDLARLPLARPGSGYGVQRLDTDTLLDRKSGCFLPVRSPDLDAVFPEFCAAHAAASDWVRIHAIDPRDHNLAIVPVCVDAELRRHVLIYGVLRCDP